MRREASGESLPFRTLYFCRVRGWTKVGILGLGVLWAQDEGPLRLVVYDELLERYFQIKAWTRSSVTARPDTVVYLRVSGEVPPLSRFPNLHVLHLSEVEDLILSDLVSQVQKYCPKLKALALEDCDITDPTPLAKLRLQGLLLDDNPVTDVRFVSSMGGIQFLSIARTEVQDIAPLASVTSLQALDLSETKVTDLSPLRQLPQLRMLSLFRCTGIGDLTPVQNAARLEFLNISHIRPEVARGLLLQIGRFPQLKVLQAQGVVGENALLAAMGTLGQMEELTLGQNPGLSDLSFVRLLRRLLYLDVHNCRVKDLTPLAGLPYLVKLSVGKNQITSLAPLVQCPKLAYLYCYENPIQDWEKLLEMPALVYVMLSRRDLPPDRLAILKSQLRKKGITVEVP